MVSYKTTEVPVSRSQEGIRKLIMSRLGSKVAFISDPPLEGFEAQVTIDKVPYRIRIMGVCKEAPASRQRRTRGGHSILRETTEEFRADWKVSEERRIWRVLFYHLKSIFDSSDSKVIELRTLLLSFIVTKDGHTVAEHILPKLAFAIAGNPARLLSDHSEVEASQ
jgi:hypothetical protein